ncbi:MFS transporter [Streptomyces synnematoformans]|uniref:MFS transporter n=1 Tax=Streptomyces synnematoformans TaxID=415721 RepID=A0ABN2YNB6_9ACTN
MSTQAGSRGARRSNRVLGILFLGMFVMGGAELLVVGVLDVMADDLGVSVSSAGALVTTYALGLAFGGPLLTALTMRLDKRTVLVAALVVFLVGNVVAVTTSSFGLLLAGRALTGAAAGLFDATAFAVALASVPPERAGRAIAVVISGVSVSAAIGVPLGTVAGNLLGWRGTFVAVIVLAGAVLAAAVAVVPSVPPVEDSAADQARHAFAPPVLAVLGLCFLVFASTYAALTYIVPFLAEVTGITGAAAGTFLLAYGAATAIGSFGGGRFADRDAAGTLVAGTAGCVLTLLALYVLGAHAVVVAVAMLAWGVCVFGMAPSLQYRVVSLAGPGGGLAQALPASAINAGIAFGAFAGGVAIDRFSVPAAVLTAVGIAVAAVTVAAATRHLTPPPAEKPTEPKQPALAPGHER